MDLVGFAQPLYSKSGQRQRIHSNQVVLPNAPRTRHFGKHVKAFKFQKNLLPIASDRVTMITGSLQIIFNTSAGMWSSRETYSFGITGKILGD